MVLTDGVHGPALAPVELLAINMVLITISFLLLCRPAHSAKREILVLASIAVAAAASRILLEPLPNVQPLTVMCLVMGATLGARRGMAFAVIATMVSNLVLSHGWWTLFQASGWATVAFAGSRLGLVVGNVVEMKRLAITAVVASVLFDWWVSLSIFTSGMTFSEFGIYLLNGLPFDALHVVASLVSVVWIAPWLTNLIFEETAQVEEPQAIGEADGISA
jgi:energy-coupling factor transport system substrate-specific component